MAVAGDLFGGSSTTSLNLVAGENLTIGDPVSLGIDGKAYKSIGLLNNSSIASPLPLATSTKYLLDTVASKIIALGVNTGANTTLYTSVGTVSASGALSWGAVTTHTMADAIGGAGVNFDAVRQSNNQLFLVYGGATGSPNLQCRIVGYSGTTTTVGTEVSLAVTNVASGVVMNLVADSTGRVLIAWFRNTTTFTLWGSRATVSGTTITLGAETQITTSQTSSYSSNQRLEMLYDSTQDRIIIVCQYHRAVTNTPHLTDIILLNITSSVSTVSTSNINQRDNSNFTSFYIALSRLSGTSSYGVRFAETANSTGSNNSSSFIVFTISTTAITQGTQTNLTQNSNTIQSTNWVEDTINNKIIFGFDSNGCAVYTRSGTTLTLQTTDTNIDLSSSTINFFSPYVVSSFSSLQQIYDFSGAIPRQVGTLNIFVNALTSQARLLTSTSGISYSIEREAGSKLGSSLSRNLISGKVTNENQIGVSTQTVSSGATAKIALRFNKCSPNKIVTGLSGLTPGVHYYTTLLGTRDVAGVTYLGYADSATELVLANPNGAEN